jgi:glycosyltransferase involved in cell wall biosynthesis
MIYPLISVALCTYNGAKHLCEQLDSIVNQTYPNLEIIVVDDCSTDDTYSIVQAYANSDSRIKLYGNKQNIGFNKNFEKALSLTSGDYVAISDQDDIWELHKLQTLIDSIGDNWLVYSNSAYIGENGELTGKTLLDGVEIKAKSFISFVTQNYVTGHTALLHKEFLMYALPFPNLGFYDWWMGFVAIYHHKLVYVDAILTRYRVHAQSVIQQEISKHVEKRSTMRRRWDLQTTQLNALVSYKNIALGDKILLQKFIKAIHIQKTRGISIPLIGLVNKYYNDLFPNHKPRQGLSRLNYAFKYSKGQFAFK